MLQYNLLENLLTPAPDDYMAQVINVRSYSNEEIADLMLKRGTSLTKADTLLVLQVYQQVIADLIADGCAVTNPLFNAFPSISGVFEGAADNFDGARHKVNINLNVGTVLRDAVKNVKTEKVQLVEALPYITEVQDTVSGSVNDKLTLGGVMTIIGSRLKFITENENNGVYLISENNTETKCNIIVDNKPARLIVMIPNKLSQGSYHLEVRTTFTTAPKASKQLKVGRFAKILSVV